MEGAVNDIDRERLLASRLKESGAWLHVLPLSDMSLPFENGSLKITVGLFLGNTLCCSHQCQHCLEEEDGTVRHGLSCQ